MLLIGIDYGIKFVFFSCAFLIFITYTKTYLSFGINRNLLNTINYFNKQGWSFFTRDPRERKLIVYKIENNKLLPCPNSSFSFKYFFGCNRKSRKIGAEYYYILGMADTTKRLDGTLMALTDSLKNWNKTIIHKKDKYSTELETGYYLFCSRDNVPYAYYSLMEVDKMKLGAYKIFVY
jgi:hypothetical protein